MEVKIEVTGSPQTLPQEKWQKIKRAANMLRDNGFTVEIVWNAKISHYAA